MKKNISLILIATTSLYFFSNSLYFFYSKINNESSDTNKKSTKIENIEKIIKTTAMHTRSLHSMIDDIIKNFPLPENKDMQSAREDFSKNVINYVTSKECMSELAKIYDEAFTESEISDIAKFYESNSGKKLLEKTSGITFNFMQIVNPKIEQCLQIFIEKVNTIKSNLEENQNN